MIRKIAASETGVTGLLLRAHFGKSAALAAGFAEARTNWVVMLDSDLQDQPEELPKLVAAALNTGADVVSGRRVTRRDTLSKRASSFMFNGCASLFAGTRFYDSNSGYKLCRTEVVQRLSLMGSRHRLLMILAKWEGFRVIEAPVEHQPRRCGRSKYGLFRPVAAFFDLCSALLLEKFRHRPLHFFGGIGAVLTALGSISMIYLVIARLMENTWLTNRPLFYLGVLLMVLGVNFFTTGLLAEFQLAQSPGRPCDLVGERCTNVDVRAGSDAVQTP